MDRDNNSIHDWMFVIFQWWPSKSLVCCVSYNLLLLHYLLEFYTWQLSGLIG